MTLVAAEEEPDGQLDDARPGENDCGNNDDAAAEEERAVH